MKSFSGPWSAQEASDFLQQCSYPLRLAVHHDDGYPHLLSLWYLWDAGAFHCVTHRQSRVVKWITANPRCGFELAPNQPPYYGLRGTGDISMRPLGSDDLLERLIDRYLGTRDSGLASWLIARRDEELILQLQPRSMASWDYRERMQKSHQE